MNIFDFTKYVLDNMYRATAANTLNISARIDKQNGYSFIDFVTNIDSHLQGYLQQGKIDSGKIYTLLANSYKALKKYNSEFKYNKDMIVDDYILEMWCILNDKQLSKS